jgi:genome maintenance exonuclease 1
VVKENITNVRLVEHVVTHADMKYRGIVDCVACYKDELVVIDFKTAEKPKKSVDSLYDNPIQVTAYCGAINNDRNIPMSVIDRNICSGLVIVAYIDGSEASVYYLGRDKVINEYWKKWATRLDQFAKMEVMKSANESC